MPLHTAWKHGNTVASEHLVALGADTEATDGRGRIATPGPNCDWIDFKFFRDAPDESILGCVEAGTPLDLRDSFGNLPLHRLGGAYSDVAALATALIEAGADVNGRDYHGPDASPRRCRGGIRRLSQALCWRGERQWTRVIPWGTRRCTQLPGDGCDADAVIALLARAGAEVDARNHRGSDPTAPGGGVREFRGCGEAAGPGGGSGRAVRFRRRCRSAQLRKLEHQGVLRDGQRRCRRRLSRRRRGCERQDGGLRLAVFP